jgi:outer membrane protein OmpA-like peptidoglycan-associated protein
MRANVFILPVVFGIGSCSSPPRPPSVDPAHKHPVAAASAVDLQVCQSDLTNTRILAKETTRLAESASATAVRLAQRQLACSRESAAPNTVYAVRFAFGSTRVALADAEQKALVEHGRRAALITLRGRTDGNVETAVESRIARERAAAVRALFVQAGIEPARVRTSYQPVGDHAADNGSPNGRALNRRVEIEFYASAPQTLVVAENPITPPID